MIAADRLKNRLCKDPYTIKQKGYFYYGFVIMHCHKGGFCVTHLKSSRLIALIESGFWSCGDILPKVANTTKREFRRLLKKNLRMQAMDGLFNKLLDTALVPNFTIPIILVNCCLAHICFLFKINIKSANRGWAICKTTCQIMWRKKSTQVRIYSNKGEMDKGK